MLKRKAACSMVLICLALLASQTARGQELRYLWQPQQKFSYKITVTVDEGDKVTTFQGTTHYEVNTANAEQATITYRGGLHESAVSRQTRQSGRSFGPGFGGAFGPRGFGGPPSPFSRPAFAGKTQSTNRITLTNTGHVLAMEGESHLPFLLGNVSLMPFETLPRDAQRQWVVDSGISITEESEDRRGFGPFGPRFGSQENKNVQAASEVTRYEIQQDAGQLLTIKKSYQLTSPGSERESFDMNGAGTWVFNKQDHVMEGLDVALKLISKEGNSSTTYPITIKIERLSADDLARMEAEAKRQAEERQRQADEAKAQAEAPLTQAEKRELLSGLASRDPQKLKQALTRLEAKSPLESDPVIIGAITAQLKNQELAELAAKALAKWSPEFKKKYELNKAYQGPSPVASTDLEVNSTTRLAPGQILQYQEHGSFWYPGQVKTLLPDGKVVVERLVWGKPDRDITLTRRNLQLAPPEVDQPRSVATQSPRPAGEGFEGIPTIPADVQINTATRTWTDKTGRFKIEAALVGVVDGVVQLRRADGRSISVPLAKLSQPDQELIEQTLNENPFEPQ